MPSEKAKENKLLVSECRACGKTVSVELLTGMIVHNGRRREIVPVCNDCTAKGWQPPEPTPDAG